MIGFIALDFILRLIRAGMMNVTFVGNVTPMHLDNFPTNPASFRIPTYMIASLEGLTHGSIQLRTSEPHLRHIAERTASQAAYEGLVPFVRSYRNVRFWGQSGHYRYATDLGALGLLGWRRKRKQAGNDFLPAG